MTGTRAGWVLLMLPLLAVPLLTHGGMLGPSAALVTVLLTVVLRGQLGVLQLGPVARTGLRRPVRDAAADRLRTPIRSCDPDGRGRSRPRAPDPQPVARL